MNVEFQKISVSPPTPPVKVNGNSLAGGGGEKSSALFQIHALWKKTQNPIYMLKFVLEFILFGRKHKTQYICLKSLFKNLCLILHCHH